MQALLQRNASTHEVAELLKHFPMQQAALLEELHRTRGNAFVQAVMSEVEPLPKGSVFSDTTTKIKTALENLEAGCTNHMNGLNPVLQGYGRARDALDKSAMGELGSASMASLELMFICIDGMDDQLKLLKREVDKDPNAQTLIDSWQQRRDGLKGALMSLQQAAVISFAPISFRGSPVPDVSPPQPRASGKYGFDVREQIREELFRTFRVIDTSERIALQFVKPGALQNTALKQQARSTIGEFASRPLDLAFLRQVMMASGMWAALNNDEHEEKPFPGMAPKKAGMFGMEVCKDDGPLTQVYADAKKQAAATGWGNDIGQWDPDNFDMEMRIASTEGMTFMWQRVMSAQPDGRVAILTDLQKRGKLEPWLQKLPWAYTKELHDGLPNGNGELKSVLQKYFLVSGKWGTSLENKEEHSKSLTGMLSDASDSVGGIGGDIIDGFDTALNFATLGFTHSYGQAQDAHNQGLITDEDYDTQLHQITARTTVGLMLMMATAGYGRMAQAGAAAGGASVAVQTGSRSVLLAAGESAVEGATFATVEQFALDTTDIATGARDGYSDMEQYMKAAAMGGAMGAAFGGTTQWLRNRTMAKYMSGSAMTRGQSLAFENPALETLLEPIQTASAGQRVSMRMNAAQVDAMAEAGLISRQTQKQLRVTLAEVGEVEATFEVTGDLHAEVPKGTKASGTETFKMQGTPKPGMTPEGTPVPRSELTKFLPEGSHPEQITENYVVYRDASGAQRIRFRSASAKTATEANPGRNYTDEVRAGIDSEGNPYVWEGRHRAAGNAKGDPIPAGKGGVPEQPGVLDYPFDPDPVPTDSPFGEPRWVKDIPIDYNKPEKP